MAERTGCPILVSMNSFVRKGHIVVPQHDEWIGRTVGVALDSGGYWAMRSGGYAFSVTDYVDFVVSTSALPHNHRWDWWAAMDYCVEPDIAKTRDVVRQRVSLTALSLAQTLEEVDYWRGEGVNWIDDPMPVLQGWTAEDYVESIRLTNEVLTAAGREWPERVGVGSVCRRHLEGPAGLPTVIGAIDAALPPGVGLHLFGVKAQTLVPLLDAFPRIVSSDSQAWGMAVQMDARKRADGGCISKTRERTAQILEDWIRNLQTRLTTRSSP